MSVKKLNDVQLVKKYEKLVDERLKINREIKQVADVMKDRTLETRIVTCLRLQSVFIFNTLQVIE